MIDKSWFMLLLYITHTGSRESHEKITTMVESFYKKCSLTKAETIHLRKIINKITPNSSEQTWNMGHDLTTHFLLPEISQIWWLFSA